MNLKLLAGLGLVAALAAAPLLAQETDSDGRARRAAPAPKPAGEKTAIAWEKDVAKAMERATKEDKRVLALFFLAGDG